MTTQPRMGVFLVRAWWEEDRFRARVTSCLDINADAEPQVRSITAEPPEVQRWLATWLGAFEQAGE